MKFKISKKVRLKLLDKDHNVTEDEIRQCFENRGPKEIIDNRAWHATNPKTKWFIAETDRCRLLKIVYMYDDGIVIKTAYNADQSVIDYFNSH